ncbi:MAG: hypothetical protein DRI90_14720 [Deltaproteobacteria bacterium]|nr:MAG: hypothetical protein DRI90_14720 [Deltaproteobacteria bacterium]
MARVPRQLTGAARVALTEQEEHTLSAVDGTLDERELALTLGMDLDPLAEQLERLAMMGVIALDAGEPDDAGRVSVLPDQVSEDGIALSADARKHIDAFYGLLDVADYYELLGVKRDVAKGDIKAAYYRVGPGFHPDKHFGKEIGAFKAKIERIFSLLTKAHDTLRYNKQRQSYDAALPPPRPGAQGRREIAAAAAAHFAGASERRSAARQSSSSVPPQGQSSAPPARQTSSLRPRESTAAPRSSLPPRSTRPSGVTQRPRPSVAPPTVGTGTEGSNRPAANRGRSPNQPLAASSSVPPDGDGAAAEAGPPRRAATRPTEAELRVQRETLAKKLRRHGGSPPVTRKQRPEPLKPKVTQREPSASATMQNVTRSAAEVLRERYHEIASTAQRRRLDRYLDQGRVATDAGDHRAAAAAYAQAEKLSPNDAKIAELAQASANRARQMG